MKTYYYECTVSFTYFDYEDGFQNDEEYYSGIIEAKNKQEGKALAEKQGLSKFNNDLGNDYHNVVVEIDIFYETTSDARC